MDAVYEVSKQVKELSEGTPKGIGCTRVGVFANIPASFLPAAHHGQNMPEAVLHIAISGPGVLEHAIRASARARA